MTSFRLLASELSAIARQVRLITILDAASTVGLSPLALSPLHTLAYFADALAPVWGLPVVDGQILKRHRPYYPSMQHDLDLLVGIGVVQVSDVRYVSGEETWHLDADYELNYELARPVLSAIENLPLQARQAGFIREVVYSTCGLGLDGLVSASTVDPAYSDPVVAENNILDVAPDVGLNRSATLALRFADLLGPSSHLSEAELVNLYVRQLYEWLNAA